MRCPSCDHENRAGRKFCVECGAALALVCAACAAPYEAGEKFCGECGAALGAAAPRPPAGGEKEGFTGAAPIGRAAADGGARKVVTIVFADLVGSTALHERLDAESARRVMERYYEALRAAVDAHGGTVVKLLGDGVMAAFGLKRVAEDDALRAVRAAAAMQEAFRALVGAEAAALGAVGLRVAVNTGEVVVSGARDDVIGDPVNVAARLQEQGRDGDVVLGEATRRLVATRVTLAPLGSVTLKGRAEAVAAYRLVSLEPPAGAAATPFVGRESELARLEAVYDAAVAMPATRLAVLLGSPGLGKSRLIDELGRRHADGATILAAHCDAAGGATFAPLAQVLHGFLGLDDGADGDAVRAAVAAALPAGETSERARIAGGTAGLLGDAATSPEETFFVVRRFLAGLAAARPVVLVIDDLHWAEPLLLDLVEHLVQWGAGVPLFVLVGARPELRELRSSLVTPGGLVTDVVTLGGLDAGAAMRLAANVIGAADLPAAAAAKVLATSEGNPLFVGELVRMLVQEGALTKDGDRWIVGAGLASLEMPPTIHALLAARIERLGSEERTVLERASVVGRHFSRSAVAALLGRNGSELDARLESLRRSELIERDTGWLLGEPVLRFHHVLIRDAAYRRLLKGTRAELHGRLADWIEGQVGDAPEHDEMIGWHLEQAHQHLRELGPLDAAGAVLGERAARRLAAAGRRALARDDVSLAAGLCGRALDRLTADAPERPDLVLDWCEALLAAGDVGPAGDAIAELDRVAADSERLRAWHTCFAGQLTVLTAPAALHATADRVGAAARELAALDDAAGEAKAHFVHAQALARLGKVGACEAALDQALAAARRAGDRRRANAVLAGAPLAALWGPSPVTRASGRCLDVVRVLRITQGAPAVEAVALSCQGVLEALRGRTEAARRMLASSRTMVEELGISHRLYETDVFAGRIDLLEGNASAAERALRSGYEGLRDLGLGIDAARAAALLGRALLAQDRAAEAETLSHESELLAGDDLQAAIAWRGVRAEALARRGDHATAITFAEAAVAIAAATDALLDHADARLALAAALRAGGRRAEADAEERRAFELWEAKGATVLAERARRAAERIVSSAEGPETLPAAMPRVQRRVRPNLATASTDRAAAAIEAGDSETFAALLSEAYEVIDHPTGSTYGREAMVASIARLRSSRGVSYRIETIATLGPSLALGRHRIHASGTRGHRFDVGEYENETLSLHEVDAQGLNLRREVFAADRLGDAIARFYERYAERLPQGPERERAAVTARVVAFMLLPGVAPDLSLLYAPTYEDVDHRSVGYGRLSPDEANKLLEAGRDLADGVRIRVDDVLALGPDGFVRTTTSAGVWRAGGGAFERTVCILSVFGPDGRVTRHETFEADRAAEALARFDALTADAAPQPPVRRRLRPNAATAAVARFDAAIAARDEAALAAMCAEALAVVEHPVGAVYGRDGVLASFQRLLRMDDPTMHEEPLATLGESLALFRRRISGSGGRLDVGAYERDEICVYDVDADGRFRHVETFAPERLRAAIVRLNELYAESLPEGPARTRASSVARALATFDASLLDADRIASGHTPSFVCVDHRTLGTWSAQGREEWRKQWREQAELVTDFALRDDDVLALDPGTSAFRTTFTGISRASGGAFENVVIIVNAHDADGLITRTEVFEPDHEAEALAHFDALSAGGAPKQPVRRRVRANAATRTFAALETAFARRDLAAVDALLGDPLDTIEHPTGTRYGREGQLESSRRMMRMPDLDFRLEPLATLGDAFCLARRVVGASGTAGGKFDVGEYEIESIVVNAVDAAGRLTSCEVFASDHLCQAIARLYALYAESLPDGEERTRAAGVATSHAVWDGPLDVDRVISVSAPSIVCVDHRSLRTWSAEGRDEWLQQWRGQVELAAGFSRRDEDILALAPGANLTRRTFFGINRASGGPFENVMLGVDVFGADGLYTRCEVFELDRAAEALARFDEIVAGAAPKSPVQRRLRPNAATVAAARYDVAFAANDMDALAQLHAERFEEIYHPTETVYRRDEALRSHRELRRSREPWVRHEVLATLGDSLVLGRRWLGASGAGKRRFDVGEYENEVVVFGEVDASGRIVRTEAFAADRLGDAVVRLYERYAELLPEGSARARAAGTARAVATVATQYHGVTDLDRFAAALAPGIVTVDHRTVGFGVLHGRDAAITAVRALVVELSDDNTWRDEEVLALSEHASLVRATQCGRWRASGGAWERPICSLRVHDADGLISRWEIFEAEQEAEALARYDALVAHPGPTEPARFVTGATRVFSNAATRGLERFVRASAAHDWQALADLFAPSLRWEDRRPLLQMQLPKEGFLEQYRVLFDVPNGRWITTAIATRGERLVLARLLFQGDVVGGGGALEIDHLSMLEFGDDGRCEVIVLFEPADLDAAYAELDGRFASGEAADCARAWASPCAVAAAWNARDFDALIALATPGYVGQDHRRLQWGSMLSDPEVWIRSLQLMVEMAPDFRCRLDHVLGLSDHGAFIEAVEMGTRDGGAFETRYFWVTEVDAEGRMPRFDLYDLDQIDQARARFAELAAPAPMAEPFANAASRSDAELFRCFNARDWAGVLACAAPELVFDERRRLVRNTCGREVWLEQFRLLFDVPESRFTTQLRATRGERLALNLHCFTGEVAYGGGPLAMDDHLELHEVDGDGRIVAIVLFDLEDADAAYAELDQRYDAGEGAAFGGIVGTFALNFANRDWDALIAQCAPTLVEHDHRRITGIGTTHGPDAWVQRNLRVWAELAPDTIGRWTHIRGCDRGMLSHFSWEGSREGGRWEVPFLTVSELDERGRLARIDLYDLDQLDQARARFAALAAPAPSAEPFSNAASATVAPVIAAIVAHDWQRFAQLFADDFRMSDRRRVVQLELDRDRYIAFTREIADGRTVRATSELLATRGERLALTRPTYEFSDADVGPSEIAFLILTEVNDRGRIAAFVRWDLEDLDAAYAELDACYEAVEEAGPAAFMRLFREAIASRDWEPVLARCAPTMVEHDHRALAVLGTTRGAEAWVQNFRTLIELAPDTVYRVEHFRTGARGFWSVGTWHGTREGGAYEIPINAVLETDEQGRVTRADIYDSEQMAQARARFAELAAAPTADRFANAATRAAERIIAYWRARDWQGLTRMLPAGFRFQDRRRIALLDGDREQYVEWLRVTGEMTSTAIEVELLATRGDRLALQRRRVQLAGGDVGPSEMANVTVIATDGGGDPIAVIHFDEDALDAAYAELDARWAAGEAAQHRCASTWLADYLRAFAARDWTTMTALLAPDLMGENHRLVGWGPLHSPAAIVSTLQAQIELAPDTQERLDHVRTSEHAVLFEYAWHGTREGGAFENVWLVLVELDVDGRAHRVDVWEPEQLDRARVRVAEIAARTASEAPPGRFANAATRAFDRGLTALGARDWAGFAALFAKDFRVYDRTSFGRFEADGPQWLAGFRGMVEMTSGPPTRQVLATRGERLVLGRVLWRGAAGDVGPSEVEWLLIIEVDERGDHLALVSFNPNDLDAAYAELDARWRAGEGAEHGAAATCLEETGAVLARRDWDTAAALYAPTLAAHDHRLVSWGSLCGPAAFLEAFRAMFALAPDARFRTDHLCATKRGVIADCVWLGTRDGGAFESPFVVVTELDASGRMERLDFYDPHHLDAARARFEEIGASGPAAPLAATAKRNAATAAMDHWHAAYNAGFDTGKWDPMRAVCAPGFVFDDRRRFALISGDVDMLIASARERAVSGAHLERTQLGTAGDRVVIERWLLSGGPSDGRFEIEYLGVFGVDEAGLITAFIMLDPDDARAAQREAWARWAAIEPAMAPWVDLVATLPDGVDARNRERLKAIFADDVVVEDHRRTGFGRIEGADAYLDSVRVLWDLAPDQRIELGWLWPAVERHGIVITLRRFGTLANGGAFESDYLWLCVATGGRITRAEIFEVEDVDKAVARLAELRPDPLRIPPNGATRTWERWEMAAAAGDWDTVRALHDPSYRFEDRRRLVRITGDLDTATINDRYLVEEGWRVERTLLATAGDRLALQRLLWTTGEAGAASEVETLEVVEVACEGRFVWAAYFDPDDRAAASAELFERYAASGADGASPVALDSVRAWNAHDLERLRDLLPADFYLDDHRRTGVGRLDGIEAYLGSLAALWELSRDLQIETLYNIAVEPDGRLYVCRWFGTNAEGGELDAVYVCLGRARGDRPVGLEIFELDDLDAAQARFEELGAAMV